MNLYEPTSNDNELANRPSYMYCCGLCGVLTIGALAVAKISMHMKLHSSRRIWYKYLWPRRLTLRCNPPIYRWLFWVWGK